MSLVKASDLEDVQSIPTGTFLDKITGVQGIPKGVITEIFGDEGVGKSSLCLQLVASAQAQGIKCLWVDSEWSYSPLYAQSLGVDNTKVSLIREKDAESILDAVESEIDSGKWGLVILDSIGGLTPRAELEKDSAGKVIGAQAGLVARFCRKIVPLLSINKIALVVINHAFIDLMSSKLMTSGGKKLAYHKALSIRLKNKQGVTLKQGDRKVGRVVVAEVRKNKLAATEGMEVDGQLIFGQAFSKSADLLQDALDKGIITKKGNGYFFEGNRVAVGLAKTRKVIETDPSFAAKIKELV